MQAVKFSELKIGKKFTGNSIFIVITGTCPIDRSIE